jgi:hypothetical protein
VFWNRNVLPVVLVLAVIALAATVIALALQTYFGRLAPLVALGQVLAALGAALFALWLRKQH